MSNIKKLRVIPSSIKAITTELRSADALEIHLEGQWVIVMPFSRLNNEIAKQHTSIQTAQPLEGQWRRATPKNLEFKTPLNKALKEFETGSYVLLENDTSPIVVIKAKDKSLLSDLNGAPAKLYDSSKEVDDDINPA